MGVCGKASAPTSSLALIPLLHSCCASSFSPPPLPLPCLSGSAYRFPSPCLHPLVPSTHHPPPLSSLLLHISSPHHFSTWTAPAPPPTLPCAPCYQICTLIRSLIKDLKCTCSKCKSPITIHDISFMNGAEKRIASFRSPASDRISRGPVCTF